MKNLKKSIISFVTSAAVAIAGLTLPEFSVPASAEDDPAILVTLGDSYSSGEGNTPFYGQGSKKDGDVVNQDWAAHRSENAWAGMLTLSGVTGAMNTHKDTNWRFLAASGATIDNMTGTQTVHYKRDDIGEGDVVLPAQLDILDSTKPNYVNLTANDFITISIGGNDIGFVDILKLALLSSNEQLQKLINGKHDYFDQTLKPKLCNAYLNILHAAPNTPLIVVGYPYLVSDVSETSRFKDGKADTMREAVIWFNNAIKAIVDDLHAAGNKIYFVDVREGFDGKEAYSSSNAYIGELSLSALTEDLDTKTSLTPASSSFHPNASGQAKYAEAVQAMIDSLTPVESTVQVEWSDSDNNDGIRPASVTATLMNGTTSLGSVTLDSSNSWKATKAYIPAEVTEIPTWSLTAPDNYTASSPSVSGSTTAYALTHTLETISPSVSINWTDNDNALGQRPESVVFDLMNGNTSLQTVTLSSENSWSGTVPTAVNKYASGLPIEYSWTVNSSTPGGSIDDYSQTNQSVSNAHTTVYYSYDSGTVLDSENVVTFTDSETLDSKVSVMADTTPNISEEKTLTVNTGIIIAAGLALVIIAGVVILVLKKRK